MADNTHRVTTVDHSIPNLILTSLMILCGLSAIFLLGLF